MTPYHKKFLVDGVCRNKTIRHSQLLLMRFKVGECYITYDIVILIRGVLLAYLCEIKKVALFGSLITEVDTEGMLGGVLRKYRVVTLLILLAVVIGTSGDIAKYSRACRMTTSTTTKHKLLIVE